MVRLSTYMFVSSMTSPGPLLWVKVLCAFPFSSLLLHIYFLLPYLTPALYVSTLYPFPFPLTSAPCLSTPCLSHFPWPPVQMYLLPVFPLFLTSTPCLSTPRLPPSPGPVKSAIISHTFLVRTQ